MRHAAKVDANQALIVDAMRTAGAFVWPLKLPVDLLVGCNGRTALVEVKTKTGKREPKPARSTELQREFFAQWPGGTLALVSDVESALAVVALLKGQG